MPIREQQVALKQMRKMREQGIALRAIAECMKARGITISHAGVAKGLAAAERAAERG